MQSAGGLIDRRILRVSAQTLAGPCECSLVAGAPGKRETRFPGVRPALSASWLG
jgi:hypothetical protein